MTDQRWCGLLQQAYPDGGYEERLEEIEITRVRISADPATWEVSFLSDSPFSEDEYKQICHTLHSSFGRDIGFTLKAEVREPVFQASEILKSAMAAEKPKAPAVEGEEDMGFDREEEMLNLRLHEKQKVSGSKKKGKALILGRKISGQPVQLQSIADESRNVVLEARAFRVNEQKVLQAGTELFDFDLTDYTGSIKAKVFIDPKRQGKMKQEWLK
ncbi:MAG: hypothetical protein LBH09_02315, partial [Peptococcaceae bacterium]|nr:hypothetical protein [Peptococcaceae bacterium]